MKTMDKLTKCSQIPMMTCSLCNKTSDAQGNFIYFGEWMVKKEITVHYYCLLLSTNLPQRGEDHSGILGFLLKDIRHEISMAKNRKCKYCLEMSATIQCATCKEYFHLTCGHTSKFLTQFVREFKSYCHACVPVDKFLMELFARKPPKTTELCFICTQIMGSSPTRWIYAKCCGNGFIHSKCMKIYALSAGYYLTCIWCKNKQFREDIKYQGVFVPDREAKWETEKGAYGELYRCHKRCDMEICYCPKGRDYTSYSKWQLTICKLCGAFGAHNPACIPGFEGSKEKVQEFKCDVCSMTEQTVHHKTVLGPASDLIDTSFYVSKVIAPAISPSVSLSINNSSDSSMSQDTIVNVKGNSTPAAINIYKDSNTETIQIASKVYTLTQSPQSSQHDKVAENGKREKVEEEIIDSDDSTIADLLVEKLLNIFEVNE